MTTTTFEKPEVKQRLPFYNFDKLRSYNGTWNFCIGGRGLGKTYGMKKKVIRDAIKHGKEFIYLRRYTKELSSRHTFMADLIAQGEFADYDFKLAGDQLQFSHERARGDKGRVWKTAGYFMALSTAQSKKSVAYPLVHTIIFDEFIIEKGMIHYIPDEATAMLNFYSTVDRYEDRVKVFFLANSVTIDNPYFIQYNIEPKIDEEWIVSNDNFIVCHFPDSDDFKSEVYKTKFGRFIAETDYADYAVGNGFKDNNDNLILLKESEALYLFTLETRKGYFSVWRDYEKGQYHIQQRRPKVETVFTLIAENMRDEKRLLFRNDKLLQGLRQSFTAHQVYFDKPKTRIALIEIFKQG